MDTKLQNKIFKQFDYMMRERNLPMTQTCLCWGIETGDGWYNLIHKTLYKIQSYLDEKPKIKEIFAITQIKEKYATLRIYCNGSDDNIDKIIDKAEKESSKICEKCGRKGRINKKEYWLRCICDECDKEK